MVVTPVCDLRTGRHHGNLEGSALSRSSDLWSEVRRQHCRHTATAYTASVIMREIPDLQVLCLRAVGSHSCSAEVTFATLENGEPSLASRLLRSFHQRSSSAWNKKPNNTDDETAKDISAIERIPILPRPCIGPGSSRRVNANEVDLNHPIIACRKPTSDPNKERSQPLIMQFGNPALDCLQSYIDTLVDLGRMDDTRLGVHFFQEWKANVELAAGISGSTISTGTAKKAAVPSKKRRRSGGSATASPVPPTITAFGSLSLHNCSMADETVEAMVKSGMCPHLAALDLTGLRGLTDDLAAMILQASPNIQRLSLKNCRKITGKTVRQLMPVKKLRCLDVGGCFNITTADVLEIIPSLPQLDELHASGLLWDDASVQELVEVRDTWKALSLGFNHEMTQPVLRESLIQLGDSLQSIALPFCENVVDNALLGALGRNMPVLQYLDLRGNPNLNTITGFYDGRASADLPVLSLTVIARYTLLSENSIEETRRVHPLHTAGNLLTVYLDDKGMGAGVVRTG